VTPSPDYEPIDPSRLRTYSVAQRAHKMSADQLATLPPPGAAAADLLASMPNLLGAAELRRVADAMVAAHRGQRPIVWAMGGHVVKAGCTPIVVDLIDRGIVTAIAMNGSTAIHDVELALLGATSEEVADTIRDGTFGMVRETLDFFGDAFDLAAAEKQGLGWAIGRILADRDAPASGGPQGGAPLGCSMLLAAHRARIPATVHVAIGTDTVHVGPRADGQRIGASTMHDFRLLCAVVADLGAQRPGGAGGVWANIGSAVVLPEVFLKAVAVARNLGADLDAMVTANLDMLTHYRPAVNVVDRPTTPVGPGGARRGHSIIGHHEILLPLLRQLIIENLSGDPGT